MKRLVTACRRFWWVASGLLPKRPPEAVAGPFYDHSDAAKHLSECSACYSQLMWLEEQAITNFAEWAFETNLPSEYASPEDAVGFYYLQQEI